MSEELGTAQELRALAQRLAALPPQARDGVLRKMQARGLQPSRLPIVAQPRGASMPLSYAQLRQWFLWQLNPQSTAYHLSGALRLEGEVDESAVQASFDALVQRHEALRTVFRAGEHGDAEQVVQLAAPVAMERLDLRGAAGTDARAGAGAGAGAGACAGQEVQRLVQTPFDLTQGPLLRVGLIRVADREWLLVVVMHHIVSDGWSMQLIVDEFAAQYRAALSGQPLKSAALPIQYADYAAWQRSWLEAGEKERQLAYWKEQLGSTQPVLQLPTDHARRADGRYRAARHGIELPRELVQALRRRAQSQGATLFMALLAGWQALLYRWTGQADLRVGVPIANRHRAETEGVVGLFVNTQVLRGLVKARMSLQQLLAQARQAALGAQAHQDLPFEQLVEALQPERSLSHTPLFQVMFNHQREDYRALARLPGVVVHACETGDRAAQFELQVQVVENDGGTADVGITYARELFEPQTIERLGKHYLAMLRALADGPGQAVSDVALLDDQERRTLDGWGVNDERFVDDEPVHRLIERQAAARPEATALVFGERSLRYGQLNARANRLAHHLVSLGVRPESRVGLALERSIEMVVGLLAVLKAGAAYVPLDPEYPEQRLAYMVDDSAIALLLTQSHLRQDWPVPTLMLDTLDVSGEPAHDPQVPVHGENLAYVIYTSGSTGRPKGAANRHRSLHNRLAWMQQAYGLTEQDTVLQKTPFGFDVSVWEFLWPLMCGARLALALPGEHRDPAQLVRRIHAHGITTLHFVPSMLQAFMAHEEASSCTGLKRIVCSGEALPAALQNQVLQRLPQAKLVNLYGPTEAAIDVTHWTCREDGQAQVAIGRPITHTQTHVLDAQLNRVPQGVAGELYLGGIGLARGYLGRPGLTAERFVAHPLDEQGGRLYRTGDLVRWRADGQLEYLGRVDHQVKIRGLRIELGEIEAQLQRQPGVREAVVVAQDSSTGPRLVAYIAGEADTDALRTALAQALPEYMVPTVIVPLESLPLNANGKVDRKALPEAHQAASRQEYEPPQGELEQALSQIWTEVLGVPRVGRHDGFFELGGHSLAALRVVAECAKRFGEASLSLADAMQPAPLHEQAARLLPASPCELQFSQRTHGARGMPLFCFPGLHVHSFDYEHIVEAVGQHRAVYSFSCHTLTRARWRLWDFESLAARHAEQILALAPKQAVALLGWSSGGDLAYETARQLRGRVDVRFVGMLDVCLPVGVGAPTAGREPEAAEFDRLVAPWLQESAMAAQWQRLLSRIEPGEKALALDYIRQKWLPLPLDGPGPGSTEFAAWAGIAHSAMMRRYRWPASTVPIHAWHADDTLARKPHAVRDWAAIAQVVHRSVVPACDHRSLLRHPRVLAELGACLLRLDQPPVEAPCPAL